MFALGFPNSSEEFFVKLSKHKLVIYLSILLLTIIVACTKKNEDFDFDIKVEITANPKSIVEPGGNVSFTLRITNANTANQVKLTTIASDKDNDDVVDTIYKATDICLITNLAPMNSTTCNFSYQVTGKTGEVIVSKVKVGSVSDTVEVTIDDAVSSISVEEIASPSNVVVNVIESSEIDFFVQVFNTSTVDTIELTSINEDRNNDGLVDATYDAIDICSTKNLLPSQGTTCQFRHDIIGKAKETITNKVVVNGLDDEGDIINANDTADVVINDFKLITLKGKGFGTSIAVDENIIVVADPFDYDNGMNAGAVYVYERNDVGNWFLVKKVLSSDGAAGDNFGYSVAVSENVMVVGAPYDTNDDNGKDSGSVYIFERNKGGANNWGQVKKILASNGVSGDFFGASVTTVKDTVVVGAYGKEFNSGLVYVFERNKDGVDNWGQTKEISTPDGREFGFSVAMSGDIVIVGSPEEYNNGSFSGSVHIFERNKGGINNWGKVKEIVPSDKKDFTEFGSSVAISQDIVVVGAFFDDGGEGSAYIYERDSGGISNWGQVKKIVASSNRGIGQQAAFGASVAISGNIIVVGAPYDTNDDDWSSGSVYIFERNSDNNWKETNKIFSF